MIKIPKLIIFPTMNDCLKIIGNEIMEILASALNVNPYTRWNFFFIQNILIYDSSKVRVSTLPSNFVNKLVEGFYT